MIIVNQNNKVASHFSVTLSYDSISLFQTFLMGISLLSTIFIAFPNMNPKPVATDLNGYLRYDRMNSKNSLFYLLLIC